MSQVDYIIVGQGLVGSALAVQSVWRNKSVMVIQSPSLPSASQVAAGLFNPITGKRMGKTWLADALFPTLFSYYQRLEKETRASFFFSYPIYRPFTSVEEQNDWLGASLDPGLKSYIKEVFTRPAFGDWVKDDIGGILTGFSGYLHTKNYLTAVKEWLGEKAYFHSEQWEHNLLEINPDGVKYKDVVASKIIFCEGCHVRDNPLFSWLPILPLKGEVLQIEADLPEKVLMNRGVYLVPHEGGYRVGATYVRKFEDSAVTEAGRQELTHRLDGLIRGEYKIIGQFAGLRPTTPDRRPILGAHPEFENVLVLNGFGTKGVSLAPYFAGQLIEWIENGCDMNKDVDISRYKSLYWKSLNNYGY